ncbi:hypothetical protein GH810_03840 [Acetobacterium paludosum]|uniref:Uncharacterized protein n=1 Tax=Acetobacterium paludosum TaxID=52693 RepID=A0A923KRN4_9FIRM|nr:hypothetical protein [Acetobacterium paludosum]MBC3887437.1 hypothetical protein [Acetobacterium paludosum]
MTRIGMIGGFGPESTLDYYRLRPTGLSDRVYETDKKETAGNCTKQSRCKATLNLRSSGWLTT